MNTRVMEKSRRLPAACTEPARKSTHGLAAQPICALCMRCSRCAADPRATCQFCYGCRLCAHGRALEEKD